MGGARGLFIIHRGLRQAMQDGMNLLSDILPNNNNSVVKTHLEMVGQRIRDGQFVGEHNIMTMQRKGASTGVMLLTCTGVFWVQPCDLKVFKASPWGMTSPQQTLKEYQKQPIKLNEKANQLYVKALEKLSVADSFIESSEAEFQHQCSHWLLHMLLSDIQTLVQWHNKNDKKEGGDLLLPLKPVLRKLIEIMMDIKKNSIQALIEWIETLNQHAGANSSTGAAGTFQCLQNVLIQASQQQYPVFLKVSNPSTPPSTTTADNDKSNQIIGLKQWKTNSPLVNEVFSVLFQYQRDPSTISVNPSIEKERGKWLLIGDIRYSILV